MVVEVSLVLAEVTESIRWLADNLVIDPFSADLIGSEMITDFFCCLSRSIQALEGVGVDLEAIEGSTLPRAELDSIKSYKELKMKLIILSIDGAEVFTQIF